MSVYVAPTAAADAAAVGLPTPAPTAGSRAATILLAVCLLLGVVVGMGGAFGYRGEVVLSGSMRPTLEPGDLLVAHRIGAGEIRQGQIISFASPTDSRTLTHRVVSVRPAKDGRIAVVTKGDANNTSERWKIARSGQVGEVVSSIPKAGYLTRWSSTTDGRIVVFGLLGLLLLGIGLREIWRT